MNILNHRFPLLSLGLASCLLLGACAPIIPFMMGGAAVGTVIVAVDRRTPGAQLEDESIELRASGRIRDSLGERVHVNVTSYNRQVLLTGEVPNAADRLLVEQVVSRVENVRTLVNELGVTANSTLSQRSSDALITGRVKAGLVDARDLFAGAFKVVTERNTTYLMGRVTQREADRATDIARSTAGVQKVIRMFEVISEEELARLLPQPAKPADKK
jgi:osmotically-inducible protein OsmY